MSKELKKLLIVLITVVLSVIVLGIMIYNNAEKQKGVYEEFLTKFNGTENTLLYIGRPTCGYCSLLEPSLLDMKDRYEFEYLYLNIDEVNNIIVSKVLADLGIESVGTPYLAIISNGKVVDTQNGFADYDVTFKFLQKNGVISDEAELSLNYINLEAYKQLIQEKENKIIVVGQSFCQYCVKAKVVLNNVADKNDVEINYFNLTNLTTDEEVAEFNSSLNILNGEFGTPITIIVNDGKIVDYLEGFTTEDKFVEFFKKNGVL